jgi:8-hydroxy-5-deazaflavin:NADPH oxidoreductase
MEVPMRYRFLVLAALGQAVFAGQGAAQDKPTVAVIGTGILAGVLGPTMGLHGYPVIYGSRDPGRESVRTLVERTGPRSSAAGQHEAAAQAQIILLAVPAEVVEEVAVSLGGVEGKIIIDVSGGEKRLASDGYLELVSDSTRAERIQARLPHARVVRINLPSIIVFIDTLLLATRPTLLIAANDPRARETVANIMFDLGVDPWDAGPLRFSRVFDAFNVMNLIPAQQGRVEGYELKLVPSVPLSCFVDVVELFGFGQPYDLESLPTFPRRHPTVPCEEWRRRVPLGEQN